MQESVSFLYINTEQSTQEIKKTASCIQMNKIPKRNIAKKGERFLHNKLQKSAISN